MVEPAPQRGRKGDFAFYRCHTKINTREGCAHATSSLFCFYSTHPMICQSRQTHENAPRINFLFRTINPSSEIFLALLDPSTTLWRDSVTNGIMYPRIYAHTKPEAHAAESKNPLPCGSESQKGATERKGKLRREGLSPLRRTL